MNLRENLNQGSAQSFHDACRVMKFGNVLRCMKATLRKALPAVDAAQLSSLQQFALDPAAPASTVLRAYSRSATAGTGELTVKLANVTPGSGEIGVAPNGGIVVLAADAHLDVDVEYMPAEGELVVLKSMPVIPGTGVCAIPPKYVTRGIVYLTDANVTSGTTLGRKNVRAPAAGAPATTLVRLDVAKGSIQFAVADAVTVADIALFVAPETGLNTALQTDYNFI